MCASGSRHDERNLQVNKKLNVVGKRLPRADAVEKAKGQAPFTCDISLPGMLYGKFLRSPHAHARILSIDTSKAEQLSGVKCVLTYKNVPHVHGSFAGKEKLEYLMDDVVHNSGEEVAAVAALTKEIAEEALDLIEVKYEVLPAIFDMDEAIKPGAILAHQDYGTNFFHGWSGYPIPAVSEDGWLSMVCGDVDKGFKEADFVLEGDYKAAVQYNCSPLPRIVVCQWVGDKLNCWADSQGAFRTRDHIARSLGISRNVVRVIDTYPIGGYGAKDPQKAAEIAAIMAKITNRPVKMEYTRPEDMVQTHRSTAFKYNIKLGVKKDGTITAIDSISWAEMGRDCVYPFWVPATGAVEPCSMLYRYKNSRWMGCSILTNTEESGAKNGFGAAEGSFCVERMIDEAAEKIGMDPVDFRYRNCMRYGDRALNVTDVMYGPTQYEWGICGPDIDSFPECIRIVAERSDWKNKWKGWKTPMEINGAKRKGIGIAIGVHHTEYRACSAVVKMNQDGSADVLISSQEMGQGSKTAIAQVVAETLGLEYEKVRSVLSDTGVTPFSPANTGSSGTTTQVNAAKLAADDARAKLLDVAATILKADATELETDGGRIYLKKQPDQGIALADACNWGIDIVGTANNPPANTLIDQKTGKVAYPHSVVATVIEVEVDTDTGQLEIVKVASAHDCGIAVNPQIVENQIDMSVVMGNGWVRSEEFIVDKNTGAFLNANLSDYKVMTMLDMPRMADMQEIIVENPWEWGPFGAKGMSETGMATTPAAIANAIYNAIGVRIRDDNFRPETILKALGKL
jgi:xanthine dehydrogenase molybdenum-binding subunit